MRKQNFYSGYRMFKKGKISGQIAILITLIVAVAFLFVAVLLNLGKISQNKAIVTLAADNAALSLASSFASYNQFLIVTTLENKIKNCDKKPVWQIVGEFVIGALLIVVGIVSFGTCVQCFVIGINLIFNAISDVVAMNMEAGQLEAWSREMQGLSNEQKFLESGMIPAFLNSVSDNEIVLDDGTGPYGDDLTDTDMDGRTDDFVTNFGQWFGRRLRALSADGPGNNIIISNFLCSRPPALSGLADMVAFIKGYTSFAETQPCTYSTITDYESLLLDYVGHDDDKDCPGGGCTYTPDPNKSAGIFNLFYRLNSVPSVTNPAIFPYTVNNYIWKPGNLICAIRNGCDPAGTYWDQADDFKQSLDAFYKWAVGYTTLDFNLSTGFYIVTFHPGIVNTRISDLITSFKTWFWQKLYNNTAPLEPGHLSREFTFFYETERWLEWIDASVAGSWTNPATSGGLVDIRDRMTVERDALQAIYDQIAADRQLVSDIQNLINPLVQFYMKVKAILDADQAAVNAAQAYIADVTRDLGSGTLSCVCPACPCTIVDLSRAAAALNAAKAKLAQDQATFGGYQTQIMAFEIALANKLGMVYNAGYCSPNFTSYAFIMNFLFGATSCILGDYLPDAWKKQSDLIAEIANLTNQFNNLGGQARLDLLNSLLNKLNPLITELAGFTDKIKGPNGFQEAVKSLAKIDMKIPHEDTAIYTWKDKKNGEAYRYRHHVKVELLYPCNYPSVESYKEDLRTTCDRLINHTGVVGVRVTRFDEDQKDSMKLGFGGDLWRFIFHNPAKGPSSGGGAEEDLKHGISHTACATYDPYGVPRLTSCPGGAGTKFARCR